MYKKRKIEAQNNQKYTENVCNPTNGGLLGESDNPQTFESDPLKHGSNGLGYNFNDYSQATCSKLSASDQEEGRGYSLGDSCENKKKFDKGR